MRRRIHRLQPAVPEAAQDAIKQLYLRRSGRAGLPRTRSRVVEILRSDEYARLRQRLDGFVERLSRGLSGLDLRVMGGSRIRCLVLVGDEADTLRAASFSSIRAFMCQSVLFPAVPYHGGVIRIQCNANHTGAAIDGLISAFAKLMQVISLPRREGSGRLRRLREIRDRLEKVHTFYAKRSAG